MAASNGAVAAKAASASDTVRVGRDWRRSWDTTRISRLCEMYNAGKTMAEIGDELDATRGAVAGQISGLRANGDPRIPAQTRQRKSIGQTAAEQAAQLAELMAEGCASIAEAARRLDVSQQWADKLWQRIKRELGPQAA